MVRSRAEHENELEKHRVREVKRRDYDVENESRDERKASDR